MAQSIMASDLYVNGTLSAKAITLPAGVVGDAQVPAGANVASSKLEMRMEKEYGQPGGTTVVTERKVVHVVRGAIGSILEFSAGLTSLAIVGNATITVDLQNNGVSVLTAVITLTSANTLYQVNVGTIASAALATGNVLEVVVVATVNTGTLGKGVFAEARFTEQF